MDTLQLRLFVSIANTLNFSRTGEQFFISQPDVTHHIKKLENSLGVRLFNRTSRKITLSEEGLEFLHFANQALEILSDGENRIQNIAQGRTGYIRIAALSSISSKLSACLAQLYRYYPTIQVDVDLLEGTELISAVQKEAYDFYFSIGDMISSLDYESIPISNDRLELFVNNSIADRIDMSDWSTIKAFPFVSIRKSDAWLSGRIRLICKNRGILPNIINYYNRAEAAIVSVNAGVGVAILPGQLKNLYQQPNVVTQPIQGMDAEISYIVAWEKTMNATSCSIFRDVILSMFDERPRDGLKWLSSTNPD
jgi:DNA-binding transcriptional LysR family regulator